MKEETASLLDKLSDYIHTSADLVKLRIIQKVADLISALTARVLFFLLFLIFSLFVNIGIALYIGALLNAYHWGFIIMSLFYLLLAGVMCAFRATLFHKTIGNRIIEQLLEQVDVEDIVNGNDNENEK